MESRDSASSIYDRFYLHEEGETDWYEAPIGVLDHERYPDGDKTKCPSDAYGCHDIYFAKVTTAFAQPAWDGVTIYQP